MPIAFLLALAGSLAVHTAALFGTDVELDAPEAQEAVVLQAELQPPPAPPAPAVKPAPLAAPAALPPKTRPARKTQAKPAAPALPAAVPVEAENDALIQAPAEAAQPLQPVAAEMPPVAVPPAPARPLLPASGFIRYAVYKVSLGLQVGEAEQRWQFDEDGSYRLQAVMETSGLAALLRPARIEQESRGHLVAGGLQPEHFRTLRNGRETSEVADFDWKNGTVRLARDGTTPGVVPGTQDLLSLNFQLAYLPHLEQGQSIGVVTGKKYERYALDALGEERLNTPAGEFRTLHVRSQTDSVTEFWLALDHQRLPVKIRFTDRKGDAFEQIATELGK